MAKRKRNRQAKQLLETLILGAQKLYWIGEESEVFVGESLDTIVERFNLHREAYDPVYGAAFGVVSPWVIIRDEYVEGRERECVLITIARDMLGGSSGPQQLTSCDY